MPRRVEHEDWIRCGRPAREECDVATTTDEAGRTGASVSRVATRDSRGRICSALCSISDVHVVTCGRVFWIHGTLNIGLQKYYPDSSIYKYSIIAVTCLDFCYHGPV